ncbi:U-box domain-containing protein 1-like [Typha angustifolia]|uniref:U-box domain-containing protein 1-like n=1 Tax=Typha angustifolia TaxID=59011 RepID=UPI003C2B7F8D
MISGFPPSACLLESLLRASAEVASAAVDARFLQSRNISSAARMMSLLSVLFEDIRESKSPLPTSSILCLTELFSVVRRTKSIVEEISSGSALWTLLYAELFSQKLYACSKELGRALDILPVSLLQLSGDSLEQVELVHRQAKRASLFVDPQEVGLREEIIKVMGGSSDCKKVEEIMCRLNLQSMADYQEEVRRLEAEIPKQAGTGGIIAVSNIDRLIAVVTFSMSVIFRCSSGPNKMITAPERAKAASIVFNIPDEFRCPISLDLMRDPVIVASGQTYERGSIKRWIDSGHRACPKSGKKLIHMALIPNYALKSLIDQWCKENNVPLRFRDQDEDSIIAAAAAHAVDHIKVVKTAVEAVRMTAEFLAGKLVTGSPDAQRQATYEVRLLAKTGMDHRQIIAEAGAIPFLVALLSSSDARTQENAVTALLNLSIYENNKKLIMSAGAIDAIVKVLRDGIEMEARENAAATLFSLSAIHECKVAIGSRPEAIEGLVGLLRDGTATGKRDACTALYNLATYAGSKASIVSAGAVPLLVGLLMDDKAGVTDDALSVLAMVCGCAEGVKAIGENKMVVVRILVELIRFGSEKGKENSICVLLKLCRDIGGEEMGKCLLMNPRSVPSLQGLVATGSAKARRKADAVVRLITR